jgi:hypothetical protein
VVGTEEVADRLPAVAILDGRTGTGVPEGLKCFRYRLAEAAGIDVVAGIAVLAGAGKQSESR